MGADFDWELRQAVEDTTTTTTTTIATTTAAAATTTTNNNEETALSEQRKVRAAREDAERLQLELEEERHQSAMRLEL